ncbi:MAG: hypothetical protein WDO24_29185 [Pseudomonadota bacterium]
MPTIELSFSDGERFTIDARTGETVLAASRRHGILLAADCERGGVRPAAAPCGPVRSPILMISRSR